MNRRLAQGLAVSLGVFLASIACLLGWLAAGFTTMLRELGR